MKTKLPTSALIVILSVISIQLSASELKFEDEKYIDDIPFNTEKIADNFNYQAVLNQVFEMPEEKNIDDIPFDTFAITKKVRHDIVNGFVASIK